MLVYFFWQLRYKQVTGSPFLPHDAMRKRGLCCRSVYTTSVTLVDCIHIGWICHQTSFSARGPVIAPIPRGTPLAGAQIHAVGKILRFSTEIAVYLGNGTCRLLCRKSGGGSISVPMTLSYLWPGFQGHNIFEEECLKNDASITH